MLLIMQKILVAWTLLHSSAGWIRSTSAFFVGHTTSTPLLSSRIESHLFMAGRGHSSSSRRRRTGNNAGRSDRRPRQRQTAPPPPPGSPGRGCFRELLSPGQSVWVVQKVHQQGGQETRGIISRLLTNVSYHPRGIKVELETGQVGRVTRLVADEEG